jgi:hypothetical protein
VTVSFEWTVTSVSGNSSFQEPWRRAMDGEQLADFCCLPQRLQAVRQRWSSQTAARATPRVEQVALVRLVCHPPILSIPQLGLRLSQWSPLCRLGDYIFIDNYLLDAG